MGSTASAFVCFVLPAAFGLKLNLRESRSQKGRVGCWILLVGGVALGVVATTVTVMGLVSQGGASPPAPQVVC